MIKNRNQLEAFERLLNSAKVVYINTVKAGFMDIAALLKSIVCNENNVKNLGFDNGRIDIDTEF